MSASGALVVALTSIFVLGAIAAWLINIPPWAIGAVLVAGILVIRGVYRRMVRRDSRQETEALK